jgi:hypothetical protein
MDQAVKHLSRYYGFDPLYRGGYAFGIERLEDILPEIVPLHKEHWEETERGYLGEDMNVDYARYTAMERTSTLVLFTVRATDTSLAGSVVFSIGPHTNCQHKLLACEVSLFMVPAHRGTAVLRLLDYAEDCLQQLGVHYITIGDKSPVGGPSLRKLLGRRGYQPCSITHIKKLEE